MNKRRSIRSAVGVFAVGVILATGFPAGAATPGQTSVDQTGQMAWFEGSQIDLAAGWGDARACLVWDDRGITECFRTESELQARLVALSEQASVPDGVSTVTSSCGSATVLYDGIAYGGSVLYLMDRNRWTDLSLLGFSNRTSSFRIGACAAIFADYNSGGGDWYPTSLTGAYAWSWSMLAGWDNRVSSVYLY
jgi:hypothetical protein